MQLAAACRRDSIPYIRGCYLVLRAVLLGWVELKATSLTITRNFVYLGVCFALEAVQYGVESESFLQKPDFHGAEGCFSSLVFELQRPRRPWIQILA